ncbi:MAG: hypothetical protein N2489_06970 [Clostridia bacterium]|nr:hypothetical protein [Clostridia bacterium]
MGAKNKVIAGDYEGKYLGQTAQGVFISTGAFKTVYVNKDTVEAYEVMDESKNKSAASAVGRGLVGGFLLGPVGLLAGGLSAKTKGTYVVAIQFKDGKKSLLEVDEKKYNLIIKHCF